jgi:hypothetical protein
MARLSNNFATPRQLNLMKGDFDTEITGAESSRERASAAGSGALQSRWWAKSATKRAKRCRGQTSHSNNSHRSQRDVTRPLKTFTVFESVK